jgi:hypothetical protein
MSHAIARPSKRAAKGHTIGRQHFAKISAVEGIYMTASMAADFQDFDRQKLTAAPRRQSLLRKYGERP